LSIYADSSFIVSSCIQDAHTRDVSRRMLQRPRVWVTPLNRAEIANAIHRYVLRGAISAVDARRAWANFEQDRIDGVWTDSGLPNSVWDTSIALSGRFGAIFGVRTLDSLHVACALELKAQKFWTFDERQARLAEAVGLDTTA
jgi:predicted nucleic acid-binding protein